LRTSSAAMIDLDGIELGGRAEFGGVGVMVAPAR
jgi:hypothetical protein